ncbi:MAG: dihydrolipoyl dehydrogenase [Tissierella sp.]|nr:dihydrolipoyl dehydrogenase [Tissierella sp.]
MDRYDIVVLGGGPGGYVAAIKAAQLGAKVAVVEKDRLGGVCLNWGCIPTKTMLVTAKHFKDILRAEEFGIKGIDTSRVDIDWKSLLERKDTVVNRLVSGIEMLFKKNKIDFFDGMGTVINKNQIEVNGETINFDKLIIATGASSKYVDIPGVDEIIKSGKAMDNYGIFQLEDIPKEIVIIGANVYAIEFATLFNSIGSNVTLIHNGKQILPFIENELAKTLERQLKKDGVKVVSQASFKKVKNGEIIVEHKGKDKAFSGDKYMLFLGTQANLNGLENLNLKLGPKGFIETNDQMETSVDGVYAIGDVIGKYPLAHVASAEGIVAAENIMGMTSKLNYNLVPSVVYSFPELASVGITEEEAKEQGLDFKVSKFPLMANGMAIANGETVGFVKIISDNEYGEIIGTHIMASHASDMISKAVALMQIEGTVYDLAKTIHPHPTFAEAMVEAAYGAIDKPIHI